MIIWLIAMTFCGLWAVLWVLIGTRGWAGLLVLALVPSLTLLLGVGNVDAAILLGIVGSWALAAAGSVRRLGLLIGLLVSIKLTPAVLVVWLITTRRWAALRWAVGTMAVLAVVAAIGTDVFIWGRYAQVMSAGAVSGRTWALAILVVGFIGMAALRDHGRWSFALAVVLIPFGSPQAAGHTWAMLVGALAPWCAPLDRGARGRLQTPDSTRAASTLGRVAR